MNHHLTTQGYYRGWYVFQLNTGSQTWKAKSYGVQMCSNTKDGILRMIDNRENDAANPFRRTK